MRSIAKQSPLQQLPSPYPKNHDLAGWHNTWEEEGGKSGQEEDRDWIHSDIEGLGYGVEGKGEDKQTTEEGESVLKTQLVMKEW